MTPSTELLDAWRRLERAQKDSTREAGKRADLPAGSSRAKVTSANARWGSAAEERDRALEAYRVALRAELQRIGGAP